jgi:hypothetical protein
LIKRIENKYNSFSKHFKNNSISYKTGLNGDKDNPDFIPDSITKTSSIERYYTPLSAVKPNNKYFRKIDANLFKPPYVAIKKGQKDKLITASLILHNAYCMSGAYIINDNLSDFEKKAIVGLINSEFATYFLFLVSSSWGIEREQVMSNEFLYLPYIFENKTALNLLVLAFDKIIALKQLEESEGFEKNISKLQKEINLIIIKQLLKLSKDEQIIVNDTLNYGLDLFEKKSESNALKPVIEINHFTNRITKYLNDWLDDVDLKVSATHYKIKQNCPLYLVKLSFGNEQKETVLSNENISKELKSIDQKLLDEKAPGLYFRKNVNYYEGDDVYIIKPNQRRFWSETVAMEESNTLLIEIMNGNG